MEAIRARALFAAAFTGRTATVRSSQFKEGAMRAMLNCDDPSSTFMVGRDCPYHEGSAARDAWVAGYQEGLRLWRVNEAAGVLGGDALFDQNVSTHGRVQ